MKILMVCLGNICRSPLAEGIMQAMAGKKGLNWQVDSAGTGNWHVGKGPDKRSAAVARVHGINISHQVCRLFRTSDFDTFDIIYVMDKNNLADILSVARNQADKNKVHLLLGDRSVPDPYFDNSLFEPVFMMIEKRCMEIINDHEHAD